MSGLNTDVLRIRNYLKDSFLVLAQQKTSKLRSLIAEEKKVSGKSTVHDRIHRRNPSLRTSIGAATPNVEQEFSRRMLVTNSYEDGAVMSPIQFNDIERDPRPAVIEQMVNGFNRKIDRVIIDAAVGAALAGEDGGSSVTLASYSSGSHEIAAGGTGLTLAKIQEAHRKLIAAENDLDYKDLYLIVNAKGYADIVAEDKFLNKEGRLGQDGMGGALGIVGEIMGFKVVVVHEINKDSAGAALANPFALAIAGKPILFGMARDFELKAAQDPSISFDFRLYGDMEFGAVRMEEEAVIRINHT